jgi:hypothetical protein
MRMGQLRAGDREGRARPCAKGLVCASNSSGRTRVRLGWQGQPQRVKVIGRVGSTPRALFTGDPLRPAFLFPAENPEPLCP